MTVELSKLKRNILQEIENNSFVINLKEFKQDISDNDLEFVLSTIKSKRNIGFIKFNKDLRKKTQFADLFLKIDNQIFINNCNSNVYPSDYVCGQLILQNDSPLDIDLANQGWIKDTSFNESGNFFNLCKNENEKQLVLVFKGVSFSPSEYFKEQSAYITSNLLNYLKDEEKKFEHHSIQCLANALEISEQKRYSLTITGYSFGSWLAELALLDSLSKQKKQNIKTVLFESPGSLDYLKQSAAYLRSENDQLSLKRSDIRVYLTEPNFLNTMDKHIGNTFLVRTDPVSYKAICEEICQASNDSDYSLKIRSLLHHLESFKTKKLKEYENQFNRLKEIHSEENLDKYINHFEKPFNLLKLKFESLFRNIAYFLNGNASLHSCGLKFLLAEFDSILKEINQKEKCITWPKQELQFDNFHQSSFQQVIANLRIINLKGLNLTHEFDSIVLDRFKELLNDNEIDSYLRKLKLINLTNLCKNNQMNSQLKSLRNLYKIERSNDNHEMIVSLNPAFSVDRLRRVLQRLLNIDMHLRLNYEENWPKLTTTLKYFSKLI